MRVAFANKYGVMKEKNMYGKKVMGVARTTFVIENGKIAKIFNNVKPEGHAEEVIPPQPNARAILSKG